MTADEFAVTDRTRVRRKPMRATYDRQTLYAILDEALIASVAVVIDGHPRVQPMIHARVGDTIILHGLATNRLLTTLAGGAELCLNVTLLDALVVARKIEDHSMLYRSVTLYGRAREIGDPATKLATMERVFASLVGRDRFATLPPLNPAYLKGTMVLELPIVEAVGKVNREVPTDEGADGIWSGTVPLRLAASAPRPDGRTKAEGLRPDVMLIDYRRPRPSDEKGRPLAEPPLPSMGASRHP